MRVQGIVMVIVVLVILATLVARYATKRNR